MKLIKNLLIYFCIISNFKIKAQLLIDTSTNENISFHYKTDYDIYAKVIGEYLFRQGISIDSVTLVFHKFKKNESLAINKDDTVKMDYLFTLSPDFINVFQGNIAHIDTVLVDLAIKLNAIKDRKTRFNIKKLNLPINAILMTKSIDNRIKKEGWEGFYKKFPKAVLGIIEVSEIVFSDDKRYCLFYMGYSKRELDGYGCLLMIDLNSKNCKILKKVLGIWVS